MTRKTTPPSPFSSPRALSEAVRRQIGRSRLAIWAERLAAALWPAVSVACVLLAAVILGLLDSLGPTAHGVALVAGGLALIAALGWGFAGFRPPRRTDAVVRLDEADPSRPLSSLTDTLAAGENDPTTRAIWHAHQRRAEAAASALRARAPDLRLSTRDRWAMRLFAPVVLAGAFVAAGDGWLDRLTGSLAPRPADGVAGAVMADPMAEAWAVPPAYTGVETVYLAQGPGAPDGTAAAADGPLTLPENTELTLRVTGATAPPVLEADGLAGLGGFRDLGGGLYEATTSLAESGAVRVRLDDTVLAAWTVEVIPDEAPTVALTRQPRPDPTRSLEVPFRTGDDYGVVAAWARIELADPAEERMPVEPIEFALPLPLSGDSTSVEDRAVQDLTDHPWAGAEVEMVLSAEDGAGQVAETEPVRFTLPGRLFTDPLARALVDQRLSLILDYAAAGHVLDTLQAVTRFPDEVFGNHAGAYLGTRLAVRRLAHAIVDERVAEAAPDVTELLWRAALSLEDGDMAGARERLREAAERLREALENGTEEDIRAAVEELRQAMNEFLAQMMREALQNPQAMQQQQQQQGQQMTQQDLQDMLDQLQNQAEQGLRDQARQMLDQLAQMLENMRPGQQQAGQSPGQQALQQLQEMIQRQRNLSDQTFDQLREQRRQGEQGQRGQQGQQGQQGQMNQGQQPGQMPGQQGQPGGRSGQGGMQQGRHGENGRLAAEQEALRRAIEELRDQLGGGEGMSGASRALEDAERSMGEATSDLEGNRTGDAVQDQMDALDRLNEGAEALAQQMQNGQGTQAAQGMRDGEGRAGDRPEADPFDRPAGAYGAIDGTGTDVPDRALIDRARRLMEELRRRSSERTRPELELEYLRRLLEQF